MIWKQRDTVITICSSDSGGQVGALANMRLFSEPPSVLEAAASHCFLETLQPPVPLEAKYSPVLNPFCLNTGVVSYL